MITFNYDTQRWKLREIVEDVLQFKELERLHDLPLPNPNMRVAEHGLMLADIVRGAVTPEIMALFAAFVYEVLPPLVGRIVRHQRLPVFRVHMHGGHSISGFHRDRDWGQKSNVLNLWLPFTDAWDTNSIWIESQEGANDHQPVTLSFGQALIFPGADLSHGSIRNKTGSTRVSCDVRFALG